MTTSQADALQQYASCVYEPSDIIELRFIKADSPVTQLWMLAGELVGRVAELDARNAAGRNVYAGANPRKAHGGDTAADVELARCLFADFDGGATPEQATGRIEAAGLPMPTLIVTSGHGCHSWWRLDAPIADLAVWSMLQKRLALALGSDTTIHDPPRIMRLPGFLNVKRKPYVRAKLFVADPSRTFWQGAFEAALPELPPPPKPPAPPEYVVAGRAGDIMRRAAAYIGKMPPGISGAYGHTATWKAACALVGGFGLTAEQAFPLLAAYSQRCDPPWPESALWHKLHDAEKRCPTRGYLLHRIQRIEQRCNRKLNLA